MLPEDGLCQLVYGTHNANNIQRHFMYDFCERKILPLRRNVF